MTLSDPFWAGKVALVTGGSAGLGKEIARAFAASGAKVVIAARAQAALDMAAEELRSAGGDVLPVAADVTSDEQVVALVARAVEHYGRLDVLVNNAGRSDRRAVLDTSPEEFRDSFEVNLLAAVRCTRAAAPYLLATRGHVVNIGSLAAKAAARHLGAYPASKFALAAYSQQLRLELGPQGLHVLLVCPGPIAREQLRTYGVESDPNLPPEAAKPGGGVKTKPIDPAKLAARIVDACQRRRPEIVVPGKARLLFAVGQLWPSLGDYLVRKFTG
jgi:NAD(P)-dependent dehydrogenase (short-subunit alcohol dehydrogenase family)